MTDSLAERRKHKRYKVEGLQGYLYILSDLVITNISIGGMAIETEKRLDIDREYIFRIRNGGAFTSIKGRSVWSFLGQVEEKHTGNLIPIYKTGIMFTDLLDSRGETVLNFIDKNKMSTSERRLRGTRFKVIDSENIKICYPCKYDVKGISLSGMEMETEHPISADTSHDLELIFDSRKLNLKGRVIHCKEVSTLNTVRYKIGVEFIGVLDKDIKILKSFLQTLK
jgi:hypothetical protein